jgi:predicted ATPase
VTTENTVDDLLIPAFFRDSRLSKSLKPQTLLLEQPLFRGIVAELNQIDIFNHIPVYNFEEEQPKKASLIESQLYLEEDSSNLAIVLQNILADKEKKRLFLNMLTYVLPFVEDIRIEPFADKYLIIILRESYSTIDLPMAFLSQGTLNVISLVTILYFQEKPLLLIEEPEKHTYPYLVSKMMGMLKEISKRKQIIITTPESETVKYANLENLLFISRNQEGFSVISKLADKPEVKIFLHSEEIGIEDLYIDNLLGI